MSELIKRLLKQLFCNHGYQHAETYILESTGEDMLKVFRCSKCGKEKLVHWSYLP